MAMQTPKGNLVQDEPSMEGQEALGQRMNDWIALREGARPAEWPRQAGFLQTRLMLPMEEYPSGLQYMVRAGGMVQYRCVDGHGMPNAWKTTDGPGFLDALRIDFKLQSDTVKRSCRAAAFKRKARHERGPMGRLRRPTFEDVPGACWNCGQHWDDGRQFCNKTCRQRYQVLMWHRRQHKEAAQAA